MIPPTITPMCVMSRCAKRFEHLRNKRHVGAVENADAQPIDVLVLGGLGDRFDPLPQPAVDHMKTGVAQPAGDDFDAPVVAVEADFGQQHALRNGPFVHGIRSPCGRWSKPAEHVGERIHAFLRP